MRIILSITLLISAAGCAPLFVPMVPRLSAGEQQSYDHVWDNMLTPVQRVDRQTLLDTTVALWLFEMGVDRMHMTSEKRFAHGTVLMEIDCDRANPDIDQYTITLLDEHGRTTRRERYSRADVEESARALHGMDNLRPAEAISAKSDDNANVKPTAIPQTSSGPAAGSANRGATESAETAEKQKLRLESERRWRAVIAATQPARVETP